MYTYYNPHPQNKLVGDCVKRAITKASGKTYQEVSNDLNRIKRDIGASSYASNKVWVQYVEKNLNGIKVSYPAVKGQPRMNGKTFCETHPTGVYILNMARHLACCVDGVIYDTWNCLEKCVYNSYQIPPKMVPMPGLDKFPEFLGDVSADCMNDIDTKVAHSKGPAYILGEQIINEMAMLSGSKIKKTKTNELWISLNYDNYDDVLQALLHRPEYKHLRWETKRGSNKSKIWDEKSGMTIILKSGSGAYLWCTNNGK